MNIDIRRLADHLQHARHAHLGLTPSPVKSKRPQSAILRDHNLNGFQASLERAHQRWPTKATFSLVGADQSAGDGEEYPGLEDLIDPEILMDLDCGAVMDDEGNPLDAGNY